MVEENVIEEIAKGDPMLEQDLEKMGTTEGESLSDASALDMAYNLAAPEKFEGFEKIQPLIDKAKAEYEKLSPKDQEKVNLAVERVRTADKAFIMPTYQRKAAEINQGVNAAEILDRAA